MPVVVEPSRDQVHEIIERWGNRESFVIEMLQDVQQEARCLPTRALEQVSCETGVPMARLYHLATFYKAFSLTPRGEHVVHVCLGTACHVKGGVRVLEACSRHLGIEAGETTENREYSLESVQCLGCCGLAAVMTVGEDLYGHVTSVKVPRILKKYDKAVEKDEVVAA
jgi:NADH-quinone oxidoreductase subunit E